MIGLLGIIISLGLLMYLAYRGFSVIVIAPLLALLAALIGGFSAGAPEPHLLATYTEIFMVNLANYVKSYFPIFLLGALFGRVMDDTGAAQSIANFITKRLGKSQAIMAVVLSCAVLTYGGVSLFVVAFAVYPIGAALFRETGIPKRFLPGSIALGAFTFTMTALPGTPQIQNAIPMQYFGTDAYAAPTLGIVAAIVMFGGGMLWLNYRSKAAMAKGEGYGDHKEHIVANTKDDLPPIQIALLPILIVLLLNLYLSRVFFNKLDLTYLEQYKTTAGKVVGNWSLIISLVVAILVVLGTNYKRLPNILKTINEGAHGSFLAIMNTASEVGYGNVISSLAAFAVLKAFILGISSNPLISEAISVSSLAGITGSASGGLSIALAALGETYLKQATAIGLSPQVLHRVAAVACGGLDTLPHNGAVITLLGITGLTHKQSYKDIGMCTVVIPTIAVAVIIVLGSFGIV